MTTNEIIQKVEDVTTYLKTISDRTFPEQAGNQCNNCEQVSAGAALSDYAIDRYVTVDNPEQAEINAVTVYTKDNDGDTMLHTAIILRQSTRAMLFVSEASTHEWLSFKNRLFQTPLHLAAIGNQQDVVRKLVVAGADVTSQDKDGSTALHIASWNGNLHVLKSLLEPVQYNETRHIKYEIPYQSIPQDLSIRNYNGLTCLHLAAMQGHLNIVEILTNINSDILNVKEGKCGRTILHHACLSGDINLVKLLLRHRKCDVNARAFDGYTPFDFARARGHDHICTTLAAEGARKSV